MLGLHIIEHFRLNFNCQYSNMGIKNVYSKKKSTRTIKMPPLSNFRWQNCKEHPNRFTKNGNMAEISNR